MEDVRCSFGRGEGEEEAIEIILIICYVGVVWLKI